MKTFYKNPMRAAFVEKRNREMLAKGYIPKSLIPDLGLVDISTIAVRIANKEIAVEKVGKFAYLKLADIKRIWPAAFKGRDVRAEVEELISIT